MKNPYLNSGLRDTDVITTEWPSVSPSMLAMHEAMERSHAPEEIRQDLFALIKARKAINDAFLACSHAKRLNAHLPAVQKRLDDIGELITNAYKLFPLSIVGQSIAKRSKSKEQAIMNEIMHTDDHGPDIPTRGWYPKHD